MHRAQARIHVTNASTNDETRETKSLRLINESLKAELAKEKKLRAAADLRASANERKRMSIQRTLDAGFSDGT